MPSPVVKIAVVGPLASGKSSFINFATETRETLAENYIPTIPVRIIEYEVPSTTKSRSQTSNVQVFDCSGDTKFEHTWPAISYKLNGTIFVYNAEDKKHAEELNLWYNNFVEKPNLPEKCCLVVATRKIRDDDDARPGPDAKLSTLFNDIPRIDFTGKTDEIETIKQSFSEFLKKVLDEYSRSHENNDRFN